MRINGLPAPGTPGTFLAFNGSGRPRLIQWSKTEEQEGFFYIGILLQGGNTISGWIEPLPDNADAAAFYASWQHEQEPVAT